MVFLEEKVVMSEVSLHVICHWECVRWCRLNRVLASCVLSYIHTNSAAAGGSGVPSGIGS